MISAGNQGESVNRMELMINEYCPSGVRYVELGNVAHYSDTRLDSDQLDETSFVGVDNLVADKGGRVDASYPPNTTRLTAYEPGDILLGNIRPYLKKIWRATSAGGCSGDVLAVRIDGDSGYDVDSEFLYYLLSSDDFFRYDMRHSKGAKMPRGDKAAILRYRVPVPPIEIQREVVTILDRFRQLEAELEAELSARRRQYSYYRNSLIASVPASTVVLGNVASFKYGYTARAAERGDYRFLRITDITTHGKLSPDGAKFIEATPEAAEYLVEPGDLLMARTGATYGKTMLFSSEEPSVYASFLIRIRFNSTDILPAYYWHFAQSDLFWNQAKSLVSTGGQPQFNANVLKLIKMPLPSPDDQGRIVTLLDRLDSLSNDQAIGIPAEIAARRKQFEHYRGRLLAFKELAA